MLVTFIKTSHTENGGQLSPSYAFLGKVIERAIEDLLKSSKKTYALGYGTEKTLAVCC